MSNLVNPSSSKMHLMRKKSLGLRRVPTDVARLAARIGKGMIWHTEGSIWKAFSLYQPNDPAGKSPPPEAPNLSFQTRAGLMHFPDVALLQLVSGVQVDMNSPVALRKDMLHLACAMLDEEVFELFLGGIQPDWRPRIEASETSTRLILKLMPAQSSEVHTFDLYMSYATAWNWLADLRWQAPPLADEVSPVKHLQFTAVLHLGETRLTTCDFERLQTGDALYLGQTRSANTERIEAVIGAYVFHVRSVEAESWICENLQQQTEKKMTFDSSHPNDEELEADITDQPLISIDALPVKLVFTLGSVNMTLAQIRTLAAGGVINLHRPASATVNILANGKLLGTGELIDVDDRLAVEITTMSRPTDEPD